MKKDTEGLSVLLDSAHPIDLFTIYFIVLLWSYCTEKRARFGGWSTDWCGALSGGPR